MKKTAPKMMRRFVSGLPVAALCILMASCLGQSVVKVEKRSPNGKYKADLIEGDTGAVGGWESAVLISQTNPSIWARLLGHKRETVFGISLRSTHVAFVWTNDSQLVVTCSGCDATKIELQRNAWKDVKVSYQISGTDFSSL
jgi:hypothetical protein